MPRNFNAGLGATAVPSASLAAGAAGVRHQAEREDGGQSRTEEQSDREHLEDAFEVSHQRFLLLVGDGLRPTAVGLDSLVASRTSAGTTEFVEESQSALTLLLSTFCCWARHHM